MKTLKFVHNLINLYLNGGTLGSQSKAINSLHWAQKLDMFSSGTSPNFYLSCLIKYNLYSSLDGKVLLLHRLVSTNKWRNWLTFQTGVNQSVKSGLREENVGRNLFAHISPSMSLARLLASPYFFLRDSLILFWMAPLKGFRPLSWEWYSLTNGSSFVVVFRLLSDWHDGKAPVRRRKREWNNALQNYLNMSEETHHNRQRRLQQTYPVHSSLQLIFWPRGLAASRLSVLNKSFFKDCCPPATSTYTRFR